MAIAAYPSLLSLASLDNLNSFSSKHILMTNSQETKEKANERHGKVELGDDSCCGPLGNMLQRGLNHYDF